MTSPDLLKETPRPSKRNAPFAVAGLAALAILVLAGCDEYRLVISHFDPDRACAGSTFFQSMASRIVVGCDLDGSVFWEYRDPAAHQIGDFEILEDGNLLYLTEGAPKIIDFEDQTILWQDRKMAGHHSILLTPMGTVMMIVSDWFEVDYDPWKPANKVHGDKIVEIDPETHQILWEWRLRDYVDPVAHHHEMEMAKLVDGSRPWSHCNTLKYYPDYRFRGKRTDAVLLNSRHLDTFWMIDRATGDILWSCGQHGTIGRRDPPEEPLFSHAHDVEKLPNGNFLMYDNGNYRAEPLSRALEIRIDFAAKTASEVWSWTEPGFRLYDWCMGDANRLPNGNTLITNSLMGRIIEVTRSGDKVWELLMQHAIPGVYHSLYKSERIP